MDIEKQRKYLKELIASVERDIVNNSVQIFIYQQEANNPTYIGKEQAEQNVKTHQQRIKNLEANLIAYTMYMAEVQ